MRYQCYYNEIIKVGDRTYQGKRVNTETFESEYEAEQYCLDNIGIQGEYELEMKYEEVEI